MGVKLSGGLDSLAVLCQVAALRPRRRLVAFCVNLVDDRGHAAAVTVRRLVARVRQTTGAAVELVTLGVDGAAAPAWSAHGPRLDALPAVNARVNQLAEASGVELLLHGDGADELLATPRYATGPIAAAHGWRAGARYAWESRLAGPGWAGELVAAAADRMPPTQRSRWYWAASWPSCCAATVSPVLGQRYRAAALAWADDWITRQLEFHTSCGHRWAAADAADAFWPRSFTPATGRVLEASPFLTDQVVAAALAMPLTARYDPALPTTYQRIKAAVVALLPERIRPILPTRKQYFTRALTDAASATLEVPVAARAGLLDPDAVAASRDTATRMTAAAVESWLAATVAAGYRVPGLTPASTA